MKVFIKKTSNCGYVIYWSLSTNTIELHDMMGEDVFFFYNSPITIEVGE